RRPLLLLFPSRRSSDLVDLWGGMADPAAQRPWTRDTVSIVFSCTKGATAICAHVLKSRGLIDYDDPVARFWPEFARHGKGDTTRSEEHTSELQSRENLV